MSASELKKLQTEFQRIRNRICEIEGAARRREQSKHVGKTFVYMNSFSQSNRWPLYVLVKSIDDDGLLRAFQFETRSDGEISIRKDEKRLSISESHREIDRAEFDAAWADLLESLSP